MRLQHDSGEASSTMSLETVKNIQRDNSYVTKVFGLFNTKSLRYCLFSKTISSTFFHSKDEVLRVERLLLKLIKCLDSLGLIWRVIGIPRRERSFGSRRFPINSSRQIDHFELWIYSINDNDFLYEHVNHKYNSRAQKSMPCEYCGSQGAPQNTPLYTLFKILDEFSFLISGAISNLSLVGSKLSPNLFAPRTWRTFDETAWFHFDKALNKKITSRCTDFGFRVTNGITVKFNHITKLEAHQLKIRFFLRKDSVACSMRTNQLVPPFLVPVELCFPVLQRRQLIAIEPFELAAELISLRPFTLSSTSDAAIWKHPQVCDFFLDSERGLLDAIQSDNAMALWLQFSGQLTGFAEKDPKGLFAVPVSLCYALLSEGQLLDLERCHNADSLPLSSEGGIISKVPFCHAPFLQPTYVYHISSNNASAVDPNGAKGEHAHNDTDVSDFIKSKAGTQLLGKRSSSAAFTGDDTMRSFGVLNSFDRRGPDAIHSLTRPTDGVPFEVTPRNSMVFLTPKSFIKLCLVPGEKPFPVLQPRKMLLSKLDTSSASSAPSSSFRLHQFSCENGAVFYAAGLPLLKDQARFYIEPSKFLQQTYKMLSRKMNLDSLVSVSYTSTNEHESAADTLSKRQTDDSGAIDSSAGQQPEIEPKTAKAGLLAKLAELKNQCQQGRATVDHSEKLVNETVSNLFDEDDYFLDDKKGFVGNEIQESDRIQVFLNVLERGLLGKYGILAQSSSERPVSPDAEIALQIKPHGDLLTVFNIVSLLRPGALDVNLANLIVELLVDSRFLIMHRDVQSLYYRNEWYTINSLSCLSEPLGLFNASNFSALLASAEKNSKVKAFANAFGPMSGAQAVFICKTSSKQYATVPPRFPSKVEFPRLFGKLADCYQGESQCLGINRLEEPDVPFFLVSRLVNPTDKTPTKTYVDANELQMWHSVEGQALNRFVPWGGPHEVRVLGLLHRNYEPSNDYDVEALGYETMKFYSELSRLFGLGKPEMGALKDSTTDKNVELYFYTLPSISLDGSSVYSTGSQLREAILTFQQYLSRFTKTVITSLFDSPDGGQTLVPTRRHILIICMEPQVQELPQCTEKTLELIKYTAHALFLRHLATELDIPNALTWLKSRIVMVSVPLTSAVYRTSLGMSIVSKTYRMLRKDRYVCLGGLDPVVQCIKLHQRRQWRTMSLVSPLVVLNPAAVYPSSMLPVLSFSGSHSWKTERVLHVQFHLDILPLAPKRGAPFSQVGAFSVPSLWNSTAVLNVVWCEASGEVIENKHFLAVREVEASSVDLENLCLARPSGLKKAFPGVKCRCLDISSAFWTPNALIPLIIDMWLHTLRLIEYMDYNWRIVFATMCKHVPTLVRILVDCAKSTFALAKVFRDDPSVSSQVLKMSPYCASRRIISISFLKNGFMSGTSIFNLNIKDSATTRTTSNGVSAHFYAFASAIDGGEPPSHSKPEVKLNRQVTSILWQQLLGVSFEQIMSYRNLSAVDRQVFSKLLSQHKDVSFDVDFLDSVYEKMLSMTGYDSSSGGLDFFEGSYNDEFEMRTLCRLMIFAFNSTRDDSFSEAFGLDFVYHMVNPLCNLDSSSMPHWNPHRFASGHSEFYDTIAEIPTETILLDIARQYLMLGHLGIVYADGDVYKYAKYAQRMAVHYLDQSHIPLDLPTTEPIVMCETKGADPKDTTYCFDNKPETEMNCKFNMKGLLLPMHVTNLATNVRLLWISLSGTSRINMCSYALLDNNLNEPYPFTIPEGQFSSFDSYPDCIDKCRCC